MGKIKHEFWTFCKAQCSAQIATVADFGLSYLLASAGLWYTWATAIGALTGGIINCAINYRWVFDATHHLQKRHVATKYMMVWTVSILLNTLGTYAVTEWSGQHFLIGKTLVAIGVALLWNYQMQRRYVYHP